MSRTSPQYQDYEAERKERERAQMAAYDHLHLPEAGMFRSTVNGTEFTNRAAFAEAVKAKGTAAKRGAAVISSEKINKGCTTMPPLTPLEREWLGCWVRVRGSARTGQVWSLGWARNAVVVIIDGQPETFAAEDLTKLADRGVVQNVLL